MTWLAIGALIGAVAVATAAFAYAAWISKRGGALIGRVDELHTGLRESAVIIEKARGDVEAQQKRLAAAAEALVDERARHLEEVRILEAALEQARADLAAADTPDGISAGLSRPGKPS